jgi:hypothetical protein
MGESSKGIGGQAPQHFENLVQGNETLIHEGYIEIFSVGVSLMRHEYDII